MFFQGKSSKNLVEDFFECNGIAVKLNGRTTAMSNDDDSDELECGKKVELNEINKPASAIGRGDTEPSARSRAARSAEIRAARNANEAAADYKCPEGCQWRLYDLRISPPTVGNPTPAPAPPIGDFTATAECEWSCKLSCQEDPGERSVELQSGQEFQCDDPWTTIKGGKAIKDVKIAKADLPSAPPLGGWLQSGQLMLKLLKGIHDELMADLDAVIIAFSCPKACKVKRVRIWIWPNAETNEHPPDANGDITWTVSQRYRVDVKCASD